MVQETKPNSSCERERERRRQAERHASASSVVGASDPRTKKAREARESLEEGERERGKFAPSGSAN